MAHLADTCVNHPDRRGFALCMSCKRVVCQECATTWDGVNHCRTCLADRRARVAPRSRVGSWVAWAIFSAAALFAAARALAWSAAILARMQ
jgi:hypothetical protein